MELAPAREAFFWLRLQISNYKLHPMLATIRHCSLAVRVVLRWPLSRTSADAARGQQRRRGARNTRLASARCSKRRAKANLGAICRDSYFLPQTLPDLDPLDLAANVCPCWVRGQVKSARAAARARQRVTLYRHHKHRRLDRQLGADTPRPCAGNPTYSQPRTGAGDPRATTPSSFVNRSLESAS